MKVMNNIDFTEFKSLVSVIRHFSNEQTCIDTLTEARWGDDVICPICGEHHCVYGLQPTLKVPDTLLGFHLRQTDFTDLADLLDLIDRGKDSAGAAVKNC